MSHKSKANSAFETDLNLAIAELGGADDVRTGFAAAIIKPCSLHDDKGRPLYLNAGARELLHLEAMVAYSGVEPSGVELSGYLDALHVHDRVEVANFVADGGAVSGMGSIIECRLQHKVDGRQTIQWLEMCKTRFPGEQSGHSFTLVTYRDITAAKNEQLNAQAVREKTEEANEAKSRFLANISHELRTPLNAILGFSELLNSPLAVSFDDGKRMEYIDLIHDSARHLLNLLNSILDMSKLENGMYEIFPENFDLARCIENSTAIMNGQAVPRQIELRCGDLSDLPNIVGDERAVRQILINLISNAIKFSKDGSAVSISATRKARTIELVVTDQGVGISREHMENLGKPFFQADSKYDRKYEGTGLGLSIVRGLVELHNGTTRFDSVRGQGTRVTVSLPINCKPGKQVPATETVRKLHPLPARALSNETPVNKLKVLRNTA